LFIRLSKTGTLRPAVFQTSARLLADLEVGEFFQRAHHARVVPRRAAVRHAGAEELLRVRGGRQRQAKLPGGAQRKIFDEAADLLASNASNLTYLPSGSSQEVSRILADPQAFRGNRMTKLKAATVELQARIDETLAANRDGALLEIDSRWAPLQTSTIYLEATDEAQHSVSQKVSSILDRIGRESQIAVVREIANTFEERTYPTILDQLAVSPRNTDAEGGGEPAPAQAKKQTVSVKNINAQGVHGVLETEEDVDRYLDALRMALIQALNDDKRIAL